MAPADLSPPGSASYSSDTLSVGDGTWDFTKNTFLLPNLMGLNFDTMQYNGMGSRFSTVAQYHTLILAHGVIAALSFLFIVPAAVFIARFYTGRPGYAIRFHAYLLVLAVLLVTVAFVLGWFAVGPNRSLTNPHHGIGVAIYVLILVQTIYGRMVRNIKGRSVRVTLHQWVGRAIALLGIAQVPLGLTLYGSPRFLFILYALWMFFLLVLYFVLSYRSEGRRDRREEYYMGHGHRSDMSRSRVTSTRTDDRSSRGGMFKWLAPLAAGAGALALFRRKREPSRSRAGSRSRSRSRLSRSHSLGPEVVPSRHGSEDYVEEEKYSVRRRNEAGDKKGGGFMGTLMAAGAAVGAGALVAKFMGRKDDRRDDAEYSAVSTDTPSRIRTSRPPPRREGTVATLDTDEIDSRINDRRRPAALAAGSRPSGRPTTPPPSHGRTHSRPDNSYIESDYSSYHSPSRRTPPRSGGAAGKVGKGLLAGLGAGWFAKKMKDRKDRKEEDRLRLEDEERRAGARSPRYTGDGYGGSPSRRDSRRRPPPTSHVSELTESEIEPRPATGYGGPPIPMPVPVPGPSGSGPPLPGALPYPPVGGPPLGVAGPSASRSWSRDHVSMPPMPPDPHGILHHDSSSEGYSSPPMGRRNTSRRRREGEAAAAAAVASASRLASDEERRRQAYAGPGSPSQPVSVKVKVHDDRDRNVTLRRLTEEEAAAARRDQHRHRRGGSTVSSLSGDDDSPSAGRRRYRRDSSMRRAEASAERRVEDGAGFAPAGLAPLSPPNPAFAAGRSRPPGKDSAYYSGPAGTGGPSSSSPLAGGATPSMAAAGHSVTSVGSPTSHATLSALSPAPSGAEASAAAADRRRRRRLERRSDARPPGSGPSEFTFS